MQKNDGREKGEKRIKQKRLKQSLKEDVEVGNNKKKIQEKKENHS